METRPLGRTGVAVSRIGFGCGSFVGVGSSPATLGQGIAEPEALRLLDAALALGVTLFDTADAYAGGESERILGRWLHARGSAVRARVVVATKVGNPVPGGGSGLSAKHVRRQIDASLARLGIDRIDLYLSHRTDPETPLEETLATFDGLVRAGKIRAFGGSNLDRATLDRSLAIAEAGGIGRYDWIQNGYSLLQRDDEDGVLARCAESGLGYTPFSPLFGGMLACKYDPGLGPPPSSRLAVLPGPYRARWNEATFAGLRRFALHAARRGTTPAALALRWVLDRPEVTAALVAPRTLAQLDDVGRALELRIGAGEREELAGLFPR